MTAIILQVDDDPMSLMYVGKILRTEGYTLLTARNGAEALAQAQRNHPDVIVLDVLMPGIDGYELCREFRRQPQFAHTPILMLTGNNALSDRLKGFEAGADNYLSKPVHPEELQVLIRALLQRKQPEAGLEQPATSMAHTLAVFSLRGGVGVSTLAVNLGVGLAQLWGEPTSIVDLALTNGQSALFLDLPLRNTWADLAPYATHDIDQDMLNKVLQPHRSGACVLAAPPDPTVNELITDDKVGHVLHLLKTMKTHLILDTPHDFSATTLAGLDAADQIILVVTPEMASVRAASIALKVFHSLDYHPDNVMLILNWTFERNGLARKEIEASLGRPFQLVMPFAPEPLIHAINVGVPPVLGQPKTPLGVFFEDVAFMLSSEEQRKSRPANPSPAWQRVAQRAAQQRQRGQSVIEFAILVALIAAVALAGLSLTGTRVDQVFCQIGAAFGISCGKLFGESFNNLDQWRKIRGTWALNNGELCGGPGEGRIFAPPLPVDDYVIDVDVARLMTGDGYGIFFRAQNIEKVNGYTFQYDPGLRGFAFRKWVNGNEISVPIARVAVPTNYAWHRVDRKVQVKVVGSTFTALIDGTPVLSVNDSTYPSGGIGLRTWTNSQACFDNISVRRP